MSGARFVRADLHVHTYPDSEAGPIVPIDQYLDAAVERGISVLGITDHNAIGSVADAIAAVGERDLFVVPGIEITTHQGHLLALFDPEHLTELTDFASPTNLQLKADALDGSIRSSRSMLDLVNEIAARRGLAIPAHIDQGKGIAESMQPSELIELLTSPGLAGLEFGTSEALRAWFSDDDTDAPRKAAYRARIANDELAQRGIARLMSSDAHSPEQVGRDRASRTLTRIRLDDLNFDALRNAIVHNPKARCKAEVVLPDSYPHLVSASFEGGFLDGMSVDLSPNMTSFIGGRGSGKSTALIAMRAALGAHVSPEDDPDDEGRMPDKTIVTFIDPLGSERTATRTRGSHPVDETGLPISLALADLGQDESGRLARGYSTNGAELLEFIDGFVDLQRFLEQERATLADLDDNAAEIKRTLPNKKRVEELESELKQLSASLDAAKDGKLDSLVQWASVLASHSPFLDTLQAHLDAAAGDVAALPRIDFDTLATQQGIDLTTEPASKFVPGDEGLRNEVATFNAQLEAAYRDAAARTREAAKPPQATIAQWRDTLARWQKRLDELRAELEAKGLKVQAGEVVRIAKRHGQAQTELNELKARDLKHAEAQRARRELTSRLYTTWDNIFQARKASLRRVTQSANRTSDGMLIHVTFRQQATLESWCTWLTSTFQFRAPRVQQIAKAISPRDFVDAWLGAGIQTLTVDSDTVFTQTVLDRSPVQWNRWDELFKLQTMRLEDAVTIEVQEQRSSPTRRAFDHLSAGQQRSVLLSLLLCADRNEPLILDQPEDHLDAQYIAGSVVRHLEAAKERRQVIIATHSANLTVLGDTELVLPMSSDGRHGTYTDPGAVDRPATREQVCTLLEGGRSAYQRRGERYGFQFRT